MPRHPHRTPYLPRVVNNGISCDSAAFSACLLQVAGVIIGARNAAHVADHEKIFSFQLDQGQSAKGPVFVAVGPSVAGVNAC